MGSRCPSAATTTVVAAPCTKCVPRNLTETLVQRISAAEHAFVSKLGQTDEQLLKLLRLSDSHEASLNGLLLGQGQLETSIRQKCSLANQATKAVAAALDDQAVRLAAASNKQQDMLRCLEASVRRLQREVLLGAKEAEAAVRFEGVARDARQLLGDAEHGPVAARDATTRTGAALQGLNSEPETPRGCVEELRAATHRSDLEASHASGEPVPRGDAKHMGSECAGVASRGHAAEGDASHGRAEQKGKAAQRRMELEATPTRKEPPSRGSAAGKNGERTSTGGRRPLSQVESAHHSAERACWRACSESWADASEAEPRSCRQRPFSAGGDGEERSDPKAMPETRAEGSSKPRGRDAPHAEAKRGADSEGWQLARRRRRPGRGGAAARQASKTSWGEPAKALWRAPRDRLTPGQVVQSRFGNGTFDAAVVSDSGGMVKLKWQYDGSEVEVERAAVVPYELGKIHQALSEQVGVGRRW